jgi:dTDP-4-amino-4,6-dideoxygalactose transaminase
MRLNLPWTDHRELEEIAKVLETGFFTQGPKVKQFEQMVTAFVGVKFGFATSSCTTALHLGLSALNIKPGDEVLVADFTFPATANVVVQHGATPVLVDIDLDTYTINIQDMSEKITSKTRAIIPVDAFGLSANLGPILEAGKNFNIPVLEDAACALGATYHSKYCGNLSTATCFSFHPRKSVTTGEGGMVTTNDEALAERIQLLRNHGGKKIGYWFEYEEAGYNYRLSDIQGAMGLAQMEKLARVLELKKTLAKELTNRLEDIPGIRLPINPVWGEHTYQSYIILVDEELDRDLIITELRALDIECTLGTYALHDQPFFQRSFGYKTGQLPKSHAAFTRTIALPFYPLMNSDDLDILAGAVSKVMKKNRGR